MSDDDLEVLFENVPINRQKAQKIKSETTEYLKERRVQLQTSKLTFRKRDKTNVSCTESKLGGSSNSLQFKTVKYYNGFEKQEKIKSDVLTNFDELASPASSVISLPQKNDEHFHAESSVSKSRESNTNNDSFHEVLRVEEDNYLRSVKLSPNATAQNNTISNSQISPKPTSNERKLRKEVKTNDLKIDEVSVSPIAQQNIRLSRQLQRNPSKFSINGSPLSSRKNSHLNSNGKKSPKSVPNSPPLSFTRKKFVNNATPNGCGVKRKLNFGIGSSVLSSSPASSSSEVQNNELDPVSNFSERNTENTNRYLYRQFKRHINEVLCDASSEYLISKEDRDIINSFDDMNSECQELYARMHNRKFKWNRLSDIKYDVATEKNIHTLKQKGFISTDLQNDKIENLIELLKLSEIKTVCKSLGIKCPVQNKKNYSEEIKRYCQIQRTIVGSAEIVVRKRINEVLGLSFILELEPRDLFRRIHLLFNLKFSRNEKTRYGSQDLFDIQYLGTDMVLYPEYQIDKSARIFASRAELLRYHSAEDLKYEYIAAVDAKQWNAAEKVLVRVRNKFVDELGFVSKLDESDEFSSVSASPLSLRKFTPGAVYAFILSDGVDVLKRLKKNEEAISDLKLLLNQKLYLPYLRGRWFEKLITIYRMSRNLNEIASTIFTAMFDPDIDDQGSYVMSCRIKEILKKKKGVSLEVKSLLRNIPLFPPLETVEPVEIKGCTLDGKTGYKRVYVQEDETGDGKIYSSVEELVKSYYCPKFFKKGIHAENSLPSSLFGVLFWDVIYEHYVPCAFLSPFQTRPLDLSSGEFYKNRQAAIDKKLEEMPKWTSDEIASWVKEIYDKNNGKSSLVHWSWFYSSEEILGIINCIGLEVILKICERYVKKYRGVRSGFPDLFLWTPGQPNEYKFVEVKSHNDKLGVNQKLWLDFLVKIKANVEVCFVLAQGSKTTVFKPENNSSVCLNEDDDEVSRSKTTKMIPMAESEDDCMVVD